MRAPHPWIRSQQSLALNQAVLAEQAPTHAIDLLGFDAVINPRSLEGYPYQPMQCITASTGAKKWQIFVTAIDRPVRLWATHRRRRALRQPYNYKMPPWRGVDRLCPALMAQAATTQPA